MCGIAGFFNYKKEEAIDPLLIRKMCDSIRHRGPDDEGYYLDANVRLALGHRRLSIIDLATGTQPMSNADRTVWIVFNGEIYNYPQLKEELKNQGYPFRTQSDTEVIIHLYEAYGERGFARLNGIFAFAIYDQRKRTVILARDPIGVKPLYYWLGQDRAVFASEIKTIFQDSSVPKELDLEALDSFMTFRYNPSPQTLFRDVRKLYPAHYLKIQFEGGVELASYLATQPGVDRQIHERDAVEEYQRLLDQAVKRQLLSDVPVGLFLSGGVDSAVLGQLMQKHYGQRIKTFSIGFEGNGDFNELPDARRSAELIGSEHHEIVLSKEEYLDFFCRSFYTIEEPIAQASISILYYVAQLASKHLKVVLAGQGADELMAGYPRYLGAQFINQYAAWFKLLPLELLCKILPRNERFKTTAFVSTFATELERLLAIYTIFTPNQKKGLYRETLRRELPPNKDLVLVERLYHASQNLPDALSRILYIDMRMSLSDNLLLFNDKVTMANSLEMRVPFLDLDLVQFSESLPSSLKLRRTERKYIHKKAALAWLPKDVVYRKKRAFQAPIDEWLQTELAGSAQELFQQKNSAVRKFFNLETINSFIQQHKGRMENLERHLLALLSFEIWFRTWFENEEVDRDIFKFHLDACKGSPSSPVRGRGKVGRLVKSSQPTGFSQEGGLRCHSTQFK